jgi:NADH-quinone oxidoreductase subunit A
MASNWDGFIKFAVMSEVSQISEFGKILVFIITGFVLVAVTLFVGKLVAPDKPNDEKLTSYECGEEPTGNAWIPFNPRFYVIALIFLLFEVEMVFIIPWATIFGSHELIATDARWAKFTLIEMFIFMGILILGLVYVWRKGDLNWIKPNAEIPHTDVLIPASLYEKLNTEQGNYTIMSFSALTEKEAAVPLPEVAKIATDTTAIESPAATPPPVRKPMFKPSFKKPENES